MPEYDRPTDTVPPALREVAQRCGAMLSVDSVRPLDLVAVMELMMLSGQAARIRPLIATHLARANTVPERGRILHDAIRVFLEARPAQVADAKAMLVQLDALGDEARTARTDAYRVLMGHYSRNFNPDTLRTIALSLKALYEKTLRQEERDRWVIGGEAYLALFNIGLYEQLPVDEFWASMTRLIDTTVDIRGQKLGAQMETFVQGSILNLVVTRAQVEPFTAKYWYGSRTQGALPAPGRVTLIMGVDPLCGVACYKRFAVLQRLQRTYGPLGFDVLYVTKNIGWNPSGLLQPDQEAEATRKHFLEFHKLSGTLAIEQPELTPQADGRWLSQPTSFEATYNVGGGFGFFSRYMLVDQAGKIRYGFWGFNEKFLGMLIEKLLSGS